jgi:hypothetical protein
LPGDLPQRSKRKQEIVRVIDGALPEEMVRKARRAIARLGNERLRESYFTTFWLPGEAEPAHAIEAAVRRLSRHVAKSKGVEWWIGRSYTNDVPIEFHFDHDVKGAKMRCPRTSSVFFFNRVRGGQLAVLDRRQSEMQVVKPRRNRYAVFAGNLLHGVLDRNGETPRRKLPGPKGRLRITLVVNYWNERPSRVPTWSESRQYRTLRE